MGTAKTERRMSEPEAAVREQAVQNTLAANPLVGVRGQDIVAAGKLLVEQMVRHPGLAAEQYLGFLGDLSRIATGGSDLVPDNQDKRFADPAWKESIAFKVLGQTYLAWGRALNRFVDRSQMEAKDAERARFVLSLMLDAVSPTNSVGGNPSALKKMVDTGGVSLVRGLANFVGDLTRNGGLPAQVDTSKFAVGENLATTPGSVVFRNPVMELIQYKPSTEKVHARPLLIVPPQINKFYVFDLAAEKSIIRYALDGELQTFIISWKNPTAEDAEFGLETYIGAIEEAIDAITDITGSPDVNIWGSCSGGITLSAFLAHLAARGSRKVNSATVAVCMLDMSGVQDTTAGIFISPEAIAMAKEQSTSTGVLEGRQLARMFAWLRPNDLIWNYWVNNYLLGNAPPAFDILYWNSDTTRMAAKLHADFLDLIETNPFANPGKLTLRGTPIDMGKIDMDSYVIAGVTDHITPWAGCYRTAKLYGDRATFILSNSGHIQSLLSPPGNPKAVYWTGSVEGIDTPEAWLSQSAKQSGSWWPNWLAWVKERSGEAKAAPAKVGSAKHKPLQAAPGSYVLES